MRTRVTDYIRYGLQVTEMWQTKSQRAGFEKLN